MQIMRNTEDVQSKHKNVLTCKKRDFVPGRVLRATVKCVNETGVIVKMPGGRGAGVISSRCWGEGPARAKALGAIRPGDEFEVTVRLFDARSLTLSLVLAGSVAPSPKGDWKPACVKAAPSPRAWRSRKPEFRPIASGTMFLWDASNLLGEVGPENAVRTFGAIAATMSEQGYKPMFFIERRCLTWTLQNQRSTDDAAELRAFARRDDVVVVGDGGNGAGEADCAILQMAEAMPGSICVSRDRYSDYAHAYPGIVGTDRIRSFSVTRPGGKMLILLNGIAHAIVVEEGPTRTVPVSAVPAESVSNAGTPESAPTVEADVTEARVGRTCGDRSGTLAERKGLLAVADECHRHGDVPRAERIYAKVAKDDPAAYRALADMYREGKAVPADGKKAARYDRLARDSEKIRRECSLRERRLRAEAIRNGRHSVDHFAARRRQALGFTVFAGQHEAVCKYLKFRRMRRGKLRFGCGLTAA